MVAVRYQTGKQLPSIAIVSKRCLTVLITFVIANKVVCKMFILSISLSLDYSQLLLQDSPHE